MNRLRELRRQMKITQKELAKHLDITDSALSYWETGKYETDIESLKSMSKFFQLPIDYLLGGDLSEWTDLYKLTMHDTETDTAAGDIPLYLHKPHPRKEFLEYQIKYVLDALEKEGLI